MKTWAVVSLLVLAPPATAVQYLPCPEGILRCGALVDPGPPTGAVPARCDENEISDIGNLTARWREKIASLRNDERKIGQTAAALAALYSKYSFQSRYFANLAAAINGPSGLVAYLSALARDLERANRCIWDPKYHRSGCYFISLADCYDGGGLEYRIQQAHAAIATLGDDLAYNKGYLRQGLPDPYYKKGVAYVACDRDSPPCLLHMQFTVDTLISAERLLRDRCVP